MTAFHGYLLKEVTSQVFKEETYKHCRMFNDALLWPSWISDIMRT